MGKRVLVIASGGHSGGEAAPSGRFDLVIAADGGLDQAERLGVEVDVVVGDLDSASSEALARAKDAGVGIEAHPAEKDHTDLELALERALRERPDEIQVLGVDGGRPDHWLTNLLLLGAAAQSGSTVEAHMDGWIVSAVVPVTPFTGDAVAGQTLSLVPVGGDAIGVTTTGLTYPLNGETLKWGASRGVSNLACGGPVRVEVDSGTLLVLRQVLVNPTSPSAEGVPR